MTHRIYWAIITILTAACKQDSTTEVSIPLSPSGLAVTARSSVEIDLKWKDNSKNEAGFKIDRKSGVGDYSQISTVNANVTSFGDFGLTPITSYTYRVYSYNQTGNSLNSSNEVSTSTIGFASLTTSVITEITTTTAISGGNISFDGNTPIIERGVVWSTSIGPNISLPTKTIDGAGVGSYSSSITGLNTGTMYYVRAYATNTVATVYGNEISFVTN